MSSQVLAAVERRIPVLVLVREPEAAVSGFLVRNPSPGVAAALREYRDFYATLWPLRDGFVVATFEQVTGDFGAVTARVNARFGTDFACFAHTDADVRANLAEREVLAREKAGTSNEAVRGAARPMPERDALKRKVEDELRRPEHAADLNAARALYADYAALASGDA